MRIQDTQTPRRHHEQRSAREQNPDDVDRQLALFTVETRRDQIDEIRRGPNTEQRQQRHREEQHGAENTGQLRRFRRIAMR